VAMLVAGALLPRSSQAAPWSSGSQNISGSVYMDTSNTGVVHACANIGAYKWCVPYTRGGDIFATVVTAIKQSGRQAQISCINGCGTTTMSNGVSAYIPDSICNN
jgi:hypothetical protein